MHKCQSFPILCEETVPPIRKSFSSEDFQDSDYYFEDFFEGDGPLGIEFIELGAKCQEDFEYVEHGDLIKMGMNKSEIIRFRLINPNI